MEIYKIPSLQKTHTLTLCLPVSELSEYRIRSLLGQRFSFAKVRARKPLLRTGKYSRK